MLFLKSDHVIVMQVKSRMMGGKDAYKGTIDCFVQTFKNDVGASILLLSSILQYLFTSQTLFFDFSSFNSIRE